MASKETSVKSVRYLLPISATRIQGNGQKNAAISTGSPFGLEVSRIFFVFVFVLFFSSRNTTVPTEAPLQSRSNFLLVFNTTILQKTGSGRSHSQLISLHKKEAQTSIPMRLAGRTPRPTNAPASRPKGPIFSFGPLFSSILSYSFAFTVTLARPFLVL
jgi:hypothetical protein